MDVHLGALFLAAVGLHDVGPQQTVSSQLGHFHEVILADGEVEAHLGRDLVDGQAFLGEFVEVFGTHGEAEGHLLHDGGAGVGEHVSVDADSVEARHLGLHHDVAQLHVGALVDEPHAATQVTRQRVVVQRAFDTRHLRQHLKDWQMILVVVEVDLHRVLVDAVEQRRDGDGVVRLVVLQLEADAVGTAADGVEGDLVGLVHVLDGDVLTDEPCVAFGFVATDVGELVGVLARPRDVGQVLGAVVGPHVEAFGRAPYQLFVVICPFEVLLDDGFPFFGRHGWELLKESLFFFHVVVFN